MASTPPADATLPVSNLSAVTIALPTIGQQLGTDQAQLQWVISAYALTVRPP